MAPLTIGLLLATGWVLTDPSRGHWGLMALVALTVLVMLRSAVSPIWMVAAGLLAGAMGWV
jgi:chromate transporter